MLLLVRLVIVEVAEVVDLISLERGDQGALMLPEDSLCEELAEALNVYVVDHVHLTRDKLRGLLVSFQPLHAPFERVLVLAAAVAEASEHQRPAVLQKAVEILASVGHRVQHFLLRLLFIRWNNIRVTV